MLRCQSPSVRFLLRHSDEDNSVPRSPLTAETVADIVFVFLVFELMERDLFPLGQGLHRGAEFFRDLTQHHRRGDGLAQLLPHEIAQLRSRCQIADVAVQVKPVQTFHFQADVSLQQFRNTRHARDSIPGWRLRSWEYQAKPG